MILPSIYVRDINNTYKNLNLTNLYLKLSCFINVKVINLGFNKERKK